MGKCLHCFQLRILSSRLPGGHALPYTFVRRDTCHLLHSRSRLNNALADLISGQRMGKLEVLMTKAWAGQDMHRCIS